MFPRIQTRPGVRALYGVMLPALVAACGGRSEGTASQPAPVCAAESPTAAEPCAPAGRTPMPLLPQPLKGMGEPVVTASGPHLYYTLRNPRPNGLYRIPKSGGEPEPLAEGVTTAVAASSDGRVVAWLRGTEQGSAPPRRIPLQPWWSASPKKLASWRCLRA